MQELYSHCSSLSSCINVNLVAWCQLGKLCTYVCWCVNHLASSSSFLSLVLSTHLPNLAVANQKNYAYTATQEFLVSPSPTNLTKLCHY